MREKIREEEIRSLETRSKQGIQRIPDGGPRVEICGGKKEDVGLDELGERGTGVVSKIGKFGGDLGDELLGDRGGQEDERGFIFIGEVGGVLFGGGEGGDSGRL
ncbi:hypothetical protein Tco_0946384 [Tanacetum coccineum]